MVTENYININTAFIMDLNDVHHLLINLRNKGQIIFTQNEQVGLDDLVIVDVKGILKIEKLTQHDLLRIS